MSEFGSAFSAARKAGKKTFAFKGKSYHTTTADDLNKVKKTSVTAKRKTDPAPKAKSKTSHMAGIGSAPSVAKNQALRPASVTAKRKTAPAPSAPKPKASAGDNYKKMAASPGGVPGKKKTSDNSGSTVNRVPRGTRVVASTSSDSGTGKSTAGERASMLLRTGRMPGRKRTR